MAAAAIPETHRDFVTTPRVASLSTLGRSGYPQVTAVGFMLDGEVIRMSFPTSRQKYKNMLAHPKATLFMIDPANSLRTLELRGDVVFEDDPDLAFCDRLLRYYGMDPAAFAGPKEDRVMATLTPTRVLANG